MPKAIAIEEPVARYRALLGPVGKSVVHPGAALALPRPRIAKASVKAMAASPRNTLMSQVKHNAQCNSAPPCPSCDNLVPGRGE
jgi:hypothetical protein